MKIYCRTEPAGSPAVYRCSECGTLYHDVVLPLRAVCPKHKRKPITAGAPCGGCGDKAPLLSTRGGAAGQPMPPITARAVSLFRAIVKAVGAPAGERWVTEEQYEARLEKCDPCEFRNRKMCTLCGCRIDLKARLATEACPAAKWPN